MRAEVTSKGGTTEAAMKAFDAGGFQALVLAAMRAATDRGRELAAQFGSSS
jgi:pyrroline-5-carboxylate reductase